jgi:hypothetical protein
MIGMIIDDAVFETPKSPKNYEYTFNLHSFHQTRLE